MSKLPSMVYEDKIKKTAQVAFGGLRHSLSCSDGELYDMKNMSCLEYPIMQPRKKRRIADSGNGTTGRTKFAIYADNGTMWKVEGVSRPGNTPAYYLMSSEWGIGVNLGETMKQWSFTRFGDRVLLLPEKWLVKTGLKITQYVSASSQLPELTENDAGTLYLTKGVTGTPSKYPVYRWTGTEWKYQEELIEPVEYTLEVTGVKLSDGTIFGEKATANTLSFTGISSMDGYPAVGDGVEISGLTQAPGNDKIAIIRELQISTSGNGKLVFSDNCFQMPLGSDGNPKTEVEISGTVKLRRWMPELDFCFEHDNRLWGYKGKTIYASKLGDPTNWNVFEGLSTDAWSLATQKKGEITGGVSYGGYPTFFREDAMARIYGAMPSAFQVSETAMPGVKTGEAKSIAAAGGMLLYLSREGMMIYADEYPQNQVNVFGTAEIKNALACSDGTRYYAQLTVDGEQALYCFDSLHGLWMKEDNADLLGLTYDRGTVYGLANWSVGDAQGGSRAILDISGNGGIGTEEAAEETENVESFAEFGDFTSGSLNRKALSKLQLRMELEEGARARILISYDGGGWRQLWHLRDGKKRSVQIPIVPRRCDHYRIRIEGVGMWRLYAMAREQYEGSEIH